MDTPEASVALFVGFLTVVGGTLAMGQDFFPYSRIVVLVSAGLACFVFGLFLYYHTKPKKIAPFKPTYSVPSKKQQLKMAFFVSLGVGECYLFLVLPFLTWQFVFFDGTTLVTLVDLIDIGSFIAGLYMVRILYRFYKSSPDERIVFF
jgi:hypothetical protein